MKKNLLLTILMICCITFGFSQADCANALALTPGTPQVGDTTGQAGSFNDDNTGPEANPCNNNYNDLEYWFSYTAVATGETLDISVTDLTSNYYGVFILDNCPDSTPTCVASDTNGFSSADLAVTSPPLTAGTTYYIVMTDWIEGPTTFTMNSTVIPPLACTQGNAEPGDVFEDCAGGTFEVSFAYIDIGDSIGISDGTTTYPIVDSDVTAGPFSLGTSVTLTMVHSDPACDFEVGTFSDACPLPQDTCDTAEEITPGTYITTISQGSGGTIMGVGGDSAFFKYTPTEDGEIYVNSCNNIGVADTNLNIGTGPCNDLTTVASNDDSCDRGDGNLWASELTIPVTAGTTYVIEWDDRYTSGQNEFDWTLEFIPEPECSAPVTGTVLVDDSGCNPDGTGTFTVDIEVTDAGDPGSVFDDGTNTEPIVVGTVTMGPYNSGELVTIDIVALDPACSSNLVTDATFNCPAPGDFCSNAIAVTEGTITGTTITQGTGSAFMTLTGATDGTDAAWFVYTATADGTINVNACGGGADTDLAIGAGTCEALTDIAVNDDECDLGDGDPYASEIDGYAVVAGNDYYIEWSDEWSAGPFDWSITFTPAPECEPAAFDAGTINESACNPDGTGMWSVDILVEEVGDGGNFNDGTNDFPVVAGVVNVGPYNNGDSVTIEYVNADPACSSTVGTFSFTCPLPPPANDEAAGAVDLPVGDTMCDDPVLADNTTATTSVENINTADCTFAGGVPQGDVWYKVTVPVTGEVTVETSTTGEITDTVMTIYRGTSGSLVEVGCSDDEGTGAFSLIELTAADGISPGDELLVRVWEYGDNVKGTFNVCAWSPTSLGIDDNSLAQFSYYPNPVENVLTLNAQNTIEDVTMYNMLGQVVLKATPNAVNSELDMSSLSNGAYFVQVTIANTTKTVRVIKQ